MEVSEEVGWLQEEVSREKLQSCLFCFLVELLINLLLRMAASNNFVSFGASLV